MHRKPWLASATKIDVPVSLIPEDFPTTLASCLGELAYELAANREAAHRREVAALRSDDQCFSDTQELEQHASSQPKRCLLDDSGNHAMCVSMDTNFAILQTVREGSSLCLSDGDRKNCSSDSQSIVFSSITPYSPAPASPAQSAMSYQQNEKDSTSASFSTARTPRSSGHTSPTMALPDRLPSRPSMGRRETGSSAFVSSTSPLTKSVSFKASGDEIIGYPSDLLHTKSPHQTRSDTSMSRAQTFEVLHVWRHMNSSSGLDNKQNSGNIPFKTPTASRMRRLMSQNQNPGGVAGTLHGIIIDPCSLKRTLWDVSAFFLVIYDCVRIPMEFLNPPANSFTLSMVWITRMFWTCDCPLSFFTGFIRGDGGTEFVFKKIARCYLRSWFLPDVALITVDWLEVIITLVSSSGADVGQVSRAARLNRIFRPVRLLRLVRVFRISESFRQMSEATVSEHFAVVYDIFVLVIVVVGLAHIIACIWYGLGNWSSRHGQRTWLYNSGMYSEPLEHKYFIALHWSLAQFSGGMDEFKPVNVEERIFAICVMLLGIIVLSICISGLTSAMTRLMIISSGPSRQLARLRSFLAQHRVSSELVTRIHRNAKHILLQQQRCSKEADVELLALVSDPLRIELHFEIRAAHLVKHHFFHKYCHACPDGMRHICHAAVSLKEISEDDLLFSFGERPAVPQMVFVVKGHLLYERNNKGKGDEVLRGYWLSEATLWTEWEHCGTLSAITNSCLALLNADGFQTIASRFFLSKILIDPTTYAENYVRRLNKLPVDQLTDLDPACWRSDVRRFHRVALRGNSVQSQASL